MAVSRRSANNAAVVAYRKSIIAEIIQKMTTQSFFFFFFSNFQNLQTFFFPHVTLLVDSFQHNQNGVSKTM